MPTSAAGPLLRALLDPETSTWTYLLADPDSREALLVDPVREQFERDATLLRELGLTLRFTVETHVHADHVTSAARFRDALGSQVVVGRATGVRTADRALADGEWLRMGRVELEARATPGHTNGCTTWVCHAAGLAFTGDALLIRGCGRTDFQEGDARTLFRSVRERIFSLPDDTLLHPGHDYKGRGVTTVGEEKRWNPRLGLARSEDEFVAIMAELKLAPPKRIDEAVPANLESGAGAPAAAPRSGAVAEVMQRQGRQDAELSQGLGI
jgi:glyoxylase-like metal-dependent hydrolase (beta-lactamase superfamily II)